MFDFEEENHERPKIITGKNLGYAVIAHILLFLSFYLFAIPFRSRPVVIPIDLTVVVNENLDGEENEPPPEKPVEPLPPPPPEPPKPIVKPPEPPPKVEEKLEAVEMVKEKKKEEKKEKPKVEEKKPEKPKPPEKTKAQLDQERIDRIRNSAKDVKIPPKKKVDPPKNNGKTEKRPQDWEKLLNQGYKPAATTQMAKSDSERCKRLMYMALEQKWNELRPSVGNAGVVTLSIKFDSSGRVIDCRIDKSCGDKLSDTAALRVAQSIVVYGLSKEFISEGTHTINYTIRKK